MVLEYLLLNLVILHHDIKTRFRNTRESARFGTTRESARVGKTEESMD